MGRSAELDPVTRRVSSEGLGWASWATTTNSTSRTPPPELARAAGLTPLTAQPKRLEELASGTAIAQASRTAMRDGAKTKNRTAADASRAALAGNPQAQAPSPTPPERSPSRSPTLPASSTPRSSPSAWSLPRRGTLLGPPARSHRQLASPRRHPLTTHCAGTTHRRRRPPRSRPGAPPDDEGSRSPTLTQPLPRARRTRPLLGS